MSIDPARDEGAVTCGVNAASCCCLLSGVLERYHAANSPNPAVLSREGITYPLNLPPGRRLCVCGGQEHVHYPANSIVGRIPESSRRLEAEALALPRSLEVLWSCVWGLGA